MTIVDDIAAVLPELRAANASLNVDRARIVRLGASTYNPGTGLSARAETEVYAGPCRMRQPNGIAETERVFGDTQVTASRFIACLPHDVTGIKIGDVIEMTAVTDADLLDRRFRVLAIPMTTWSLYKGVACELVE